MKKIIVALFFMCLAVKSELFVEEKVGKNTLENFIGLKEHDCDMECMENCKTSSKATCSEKCCIVQSNEKGVAIEETRDKIKWWINTQASKTFNFSSCQKDCDKFCLSIKGKVEACISKCSEKFCDEDSNNLGYVFIGTIIIFCIFIILRKSMVKNFQIRESFRYRRV